MSQRWQNACVGVKGIGHTQDQNLIRTNDHTNALDIHYYCLLPDEDGCRVRDGRLQVHALTQLHVVRCSSHLATAVNTQPRANDSVKHVL